MKLVFARLIMLTILTVTAGFFYFDKPVSGEVLGCWEQAFGKWMACDGAHANTVFNYVQVEPSTNHFLYCLTSSATNCSASASTYCASQASASCSGNPNYSTCYNSSYNSCYGTTYDACHTPAYNVCATNVTSAFNGRASSYESCMGVENTGASCVEQVADSCDNARTRVSQCSSMYYPDDMSSLMTCLGQSGINLCE